MTKPIRIARNAFSDASSNNTTTMFKVLSYAVAALREFAWITQWGSTRHRAAADLMETASVIHTSNLLRNGCLKHNAILAIWYHYSTPRLVFILPSHGGLRAELTQTLQVRCCGPCPPQSPSTTSMACRCTSRLGSNTGLLRGVRKRTEPAPFWPFGHGDTQLHNPQD